MSQFSLLSPFPLSIISQSGSIYEGIATYLEHFLKPLGMQHQSYLKDTPDFLRTVQKINDGPSLSPKTVLATFDAIGLYTNIKHDEGLTATEHMLDKRKNRNVPTSFILKLMELLLKNNIFEFNETYWKQLAGGCYGL